MGSWTMVRATASWLEPCEVVGQVVEIDPLTVTDGETRTLVVRLDNGALITVNAVQEQLRFKLALANPEPGDRIRIRYLGEAAKAMPGMSPTKRFDVKVRRAEPGPGDGTGNPSESLGEVGEEPENVPGAGQ